MGNWCDKSNIQCVGIPANHDSTLIDIIATTHEHNVAKQITEASSISDHDLTGVIVKKNCQKFKPRKIFTRNYAKYNEDNFNEDLKSTPWE